MEVVQFRGTVRFPWAVAYAQVFVGLIAMFGAVIATIPSLSVIVLSLFTPLAVLTTWLAGILFRPCVDVEADEAGLTIGRWRKRRFGWHEVAGIVLHGQRTLRIVVVDRTGQLRTYGCTAQKRNDQLARPLFDFAAQRVGKDVIDPIEWDRARFSNADALLLAGLIVAPALILVAVARPWGAWRWLSPLAIYVGLAALLHFTMSFRLPFVGQRGRLRWLLGAGEDIVSMAAWRQALQQHRDAKYR